MTDEKPMAQKLFHWLFVLGFAGAYLSADDDTLRLHLIFGFMAGGLAVLRLLLFITGPGSWHGRELNLSVKDLKTYLLRYFHKPALRGNPAASFAAVTMLVLAVVTALSGYFSADSHTLEEIHEAAGNLFLFVALAHIAGVVADTLFRGSGAYKQMVGKSTVQWPMAVLVVLVAASGVLWSLSVDTGIYDDEHGEREHYEYEDYDD